MVTIKDRDYGWQSGMAKSITFIVTKDCQLACKYCYLVGKNTKERMTWEVAKAAIDYILDREQEFREESVIWDFIGGEPFLEIDLIDRICDYLKTEMYRRDHHWFNSYRFSFSTNGINYHTDKVQQFIKKNHTHLSVAITIDGTKRKHDLNRIWKPVTNDSDDSLPSQGGAGGGAERGSYDDVVKNIPLWLSQFQGAATKVTISSADIPYIKESVLHLYSLGIKEVNINCVFEDVWQAGDDALFEDQLTALADAIIDMDLYRDHVCSFFQESIGKPMDPEVENENWCGAGKMLAVDAAGNFYPCTRFAAFSLRSKPAWIIGNVKGWHQPEPPATLPDARPYDAVAGGVSALRGGQRLRLVPGRELRRCPVAHRLSACDGHLQDAQGPRPRQQLLLEQAVPQAGAAGV